MKWITFVLLVLMGLVLFYDPEQAVRLSDPGVIYASWG